MRVVRAYRYALNLTSAQQRMVLAHCGAARVAHNWGLARVQANLDQRRAERSYGIAGAELTPPLSWSLSSLRREWNQAKEQVAPWWRECSKEAFNTGLDQLARALGNWDDSRKGNRKGRRMGFPRFKSRHRCAPSCRFTTGAIRVEPDRRHVVLPRLGRLATFESTRKLARRVEAGTARILGATIRRAGRRWQVAFTVEVEQHERCPDQPRAVAGVDVGIKHLAVLSTGEVIANPRHLDTARRRLRRAARRLSRRYGPYDPDTRRRREPSARWLRAKAELAAAHTTVTNRRRDGLHKLTTRLAGHYGTIVVEDLHVAGMVGNRRLARAIGDAGFGELRRQLAYKAGWHGGRLVVAGRWYPSSKTCSACGVVKTKLTLTERTFACEACGLTMCRDLNAARNLAALVAGSGPETINGRGADGKTPPAGHVAKNRQPGTTNVGKTGTAAAQEAAA